MAEEKHELARLDPQALIAQAIQSGAGIETLERLVALAKDVRAQQAREAWHQAMTDFQSQCPKILKTETAEITTRGGGGYSYDYAPIEEITSKILPTMTAVGLTVSYRTPRMLSGHVVVVCRISHALGHYEESGEVVMPVVMPATPEERTGANPMQRVGIATTYAQRYALKLALGLAPERDTDGHAKKGEPNKPAVRQPQRKGETAAPAPSEVVPPNDIHIWQGTIREIAAKTSEKTGKAYYTILAEDGEAFMTFSATLADFARSLVGKVAVIRWDTTDRGNKKAIEIQGV